MCVVIPEESFLFPAMFLNFKKIPWPAAPRGAAGARAGFQNDSASDGVA
jgi:hypothetical protein